MHCMFFTHLSRLGSLVLLQSTDSSQYYVCKTSANARSQGREDQGKRGVKISYLCRHILKERLLRPLNFKQLKFCQLKYKILLLRFPVSSIPFVYAHLPHHGKKFCAKEGRICFVHLGVNNLCPIYCTRTVYTLHAVYIEQ